MGFKPRKPRRATVRRGLPTEIATGPDLRRKVQRIRRERQYQAIKRAAKRKEAARRRTKRIGPDGEARLQQLRSYTSAAKAAIQDFEDAPDLKIQRYDHVNADGTIDVEIRIRDLPDYQDADGAMRLLAMALPAEIGDGDVFVSYGYRMDQLLPDRAWEALTDEQKQKLIELYPKSGRLRQTQTYWRDASDRAGSVASSVIGRQIGDKLQARDRSVRDVYVRYHWSPSKTRPS